MITALAAWEAEYIPFLFIIHLYSSCQAGEWGRHVSRPDLGCFLNAAGLLKSYAALLGQSWWQWQAGSQPSGQKSQSSTAVLRSP